MVPVPDDAKEGYEQDVEQPPDRGLPVDWLPFTREGETRWMIERNAAVAGFVRELVTSSGGRIMNPDVAINFHFPGQS